jgi:hypothetical protein
LGAHTLTLKNIVLEKGNSTGDYGGAVYNNGGTLILSQATIQDSQTGGQAGGAIIAIGGMISLANNSLVQDNYGYDFGAIATNSALYVVNSTVQRNTADVGGGGLSVGGPTLIDHSQILSNTAKNIDAGGGVDIASFAVVTIRNSQITGNTAPVTNASGGGIANLGQLTLSNDTLTRNSAWGGGALRNGGTATITQTTLDDNVANGGGGAGLFNDGTATLNQDLLSGNQTPGGAGGGIWNSGIVLTANSTLAGNAGVRGGGIYSDIGSVTLINVTLDSNRASTGGGIYMSAVYYSSFLLKNTIVAESLAGGNCALAAGSVVSPTSSGHNLSDDGACTPYFNQAGDLNGPPARLLGLANNGGATLTLLPRHDSPAIDNGTDLGCTGTFDQRGVLRPQGAACDIGAVEVRAIDLTWPLFLPGVRRQNDEPPVVAVTV